ncbi:MAG: hypothetical protein EOS85_33025 [Mesorhizobium sp.]|nr:MAG: hypothetical protein EOS85_33025 [Mesorhizobium sp.]
MEAPRLPSVAQPEPRGVTETAKALIATDDSSGQSSTTTYFQFGRSVAKI